ncbi:DR2241 family protein [Natrarchaeobaculum sulfurireducens]|uniref:Uncharacterized protein n=1 Tax=Natrarchaeobaculum sulfurireducens TaxID=2044521 RepID=A0A346PQD4_9EURY|nr:DR2241 family protein [Natrarchaeobaculum sulfurireducens]AXR81729.1 hypothetical protein AArcMg_1719 [Natrarchaeobaculum sulfurireducens]
MDRPVHRETVRIATDQGIDFDGLRLECDDGTYVLETPDYDLAQLDEAALVEALEAAEPYVSNWYYWQETVGGEGTARRAFLRWCERAPVAAASGEGQMGADPLSVPGRYEGLSDGIDRQWGQLSITTRFVDGSTPDGERVYDLGHVDDADTDPETLEECPGFRAAREIARFDENDRYRPLKTAPTLRSGWTCIGLSGAQLVETVDAFYPSTIANWHRERCGELDIDHWNEAAARQTGIYNVVDELPREAVNWMAKACCVDSQCLRRREWQYADGDDLAVPGGDGQFPCREPCSLVIAAAREWTDLESDPERRYELELTEREFVQLSTLIDAVADDRLGEIREVDFADGANRYRARYLRAKRFADGELEASNRSEK